MIRIFCGNRSVSLEARGVPDQSLWCAMDPKSSVFFSSIGENEALLCLNRSVQTPRGVLEPQEIRVPYDRSLGVEDNLINSAKRIFSDG